MLNLLDIYSKIKKRRLGGEKKNMKSILIAIASLLIVAMMFSGVAIAAQSSYSVAVVDGSVRTQSMQSIMTNGDLPYEADKYDLDVYALNAKQFSMTHSLDSDGGVEAQTSLYYMPGSNLQFVHVYEQLSKDRIGEGENESLCYSGDAKVRLTAQMLQYETASIADVNNVAFGLNAIGKGAMSVSMEERLGSGDSNSTWTESVTLESFKVRGGIFNATAMFTGEVPDLPAAEDEADSLCQFFKGWD